MSKMSGLREAMERLDEPWGSAGDAPELSRAQLVDVADAIGLLQRQLDALHVDVAAGIARESRAELGADSLAKQRGYRTAAKLIAAVTGISTGRRSVW